MLLLSEKDHFQALFGTVRGTGTDGTRYHARKEVNSEVEKVRAGFERQCEEQGIRSLLKVMAEMHNGKHVVTYDEEVDALADVIAANGLITLLDSFEYYKCHEKLSETTGLYPARIVDAAKEAITFDLLRGAILKNNRAGRHANGGVIDNINKFILPALYKKLVTQMVGVGLPLEWQRYYWDTEPVILDEETYEQRLIYPALLEIVDSAPNGVGASILRIRPKKS